jgi:hypothetical protein
MLPPQVARPEFCPAHVYKSHKEAMRGQHKLCHVPATDALKHVTNMLVQVSLFLGSLISVLVMWCMWSLVYIPYVVSTFSWLHAVWHDCIHTYMHHIHIYIYIYSQYACVCVCVHTRTHVCIHTQMVNICMLVNVPAGPASREALLSHDRSVPPQVG